MHIEPGLVYGAKLLLGYGTAAAAGTYAVKLAWEQFRDSGPARLAGGTIATTTLTLMFFQVLPHFPVGVSEVHFILGSTLFLLFGAAPAAFGLAIGLLLQGLLVAPLDLPQFGMNLTTLLVPLFVLQTLAKRLIAPGTAYTELTYKQTLALSTSYQAGIVGWVAFWAFYGSGLGAENLEAVTAFGAAYMMVIVVEPLVDLAVLAMAKTLRGSTLTRVFTPRLLNPA